jgi:hypothetical protein
MASRVALRGLGYANGGLYSRNNTSRLFSTAATSAGARFPMMGIDKRLVLLREENSRSGLRSGVLLEAVDHQGSHLKAVALFPAHGFWIGGVLEGSLPDQETIASNGLAFEPIIAPKVVDTQTDSSQDVNDAVDGDADADAGDDTGSEASTKDGETGEELDRWDTLRTRGGEVTWGQTLDCLGRSLETTRAAGSSEPGKSKLACFSCSRLCLHKYCTTSFLACVNVQTTYF